jgi:hypothetical protein
MNTFGKIAVISMSAAALIVSSATPAFADDNSDGRVLTGFVVGVLFGALAGQSGHQVRYGHRDWDHDRDRDYDRDSYESERSHYDQPRQICTRYYNEYLHRWETQIRTYQSGDRSYENYRPC